MKNTKNLGLPIYDNPKSDLFKISDVNSAHTIIDETYETMKNAKDHIVEIDKNIPIKNADAEIVDARRGKSTLGEKIREIDSSLATTMKVFNVKEFGGAIGDGETDDYEAIQNCINEATKVNGTVFIPSGKYYISQTLRTKHQASYHYRPGISIEGEGYSSIIQGYKASEGKNKEACYYNADIAKAQVFPQK